MGFLTRAAIAPLRASRTESTSAWNATSLAATTFAAARAVVKSAQPDSYLPSTSSFADLITLLRAVLSAAIRATIAALRSLRALSVAVWLPNSVLSAETFFAASRAAVYLAQSSAFSSAVKSSALIAASASSILALRAVLSPSAEGSSALRASVRALRALSTLA